MLLAKVAYDAQTQQFSLADPEMAALFEHGVVYLLLVDFLPKETDGDSDLAIESMIGPNPSIGHA